MGEAAVAKTHQRYASSSGNASCKHLVLLRGNVLRPDWLQLDTETKNDL